VVTDAPRLTRASAPPTGWQGRAQTSAAKCSVGRQAHADRSGPASVCADCWKPQAAQTVATPLECLERCQRFHRHQSQRNRTYDDVGWLNSVSLGATGEAAALVRTRRGIRVSTSSPHRTSNQYIPSCGAWRANPSWIYDPCSPPLKLTGHSRTGLDVPLGWVNVILTTWSPTTSPDFSDTKIVRGKAKLNGRSTGSCGRSTLYVSTILIRVATSSCSRSTFSQAHATCTSGFGVGTG
jgi:hypothetical protein